jgi:hypothetical protein
MVARKRIDVRLRVHFPSCFLKTCSYDTIHVHRPISAAVGVIRLSVWIAIASKLSASLYCQLFQILYPYIYRCGTITRDGHVN